MKNNSKLLPILFFPYLFLIIMICFFTLHQVLGIGTIWFLAFLLSGGSFVIAIINLIQAKNGKYSAAELAATNKLIKSVHIPAYILICLVAIFGCIFLSVWGIGISIFLFFLDAITIFLSGLIGVSAVICGVRENKISGSTGMLYGFLSFIFCIDVIIAFVYNSKIKKMQ